MGLLDDIKNIQKDKAGCGVQKLLSQLNKDDREDLETAISDHNIPAAHIIRVLRTRGHTISDKLVARHRRQDCICNG